MTKVALKNQPFLQQKFFLDGCLFFRCIISFLWIWGFHIDAAKTHVYWDIRAYRYACGLLDPEYKAVRSLKIFATIFQFTRLHMPEDLFLQIRWFYRTQMIVTITSGPYHLSQLWKILSKFSPYQDRLGFLTVSFFNPKLGISWHCQSQIECISSSKWTVRLTHLRLINTKQLLKNKIKTNYLPN